jgi:PAS domain S-box-containing protein
MPMHRLPNTIDRTSEPEERELAASQENYRSLIELTPDIIYRLKEDGTILFISPAVRQLGYDPGELIGKPFEEIVFPADRQKSRDHFVERRIGERRTMNLEIRLLNRQQGAAYYELKYTYLTLSARGYWDVPRASHGISPSASGWRSASIAPRKWRHWARWPAGWPMI